MYLKIFGQPTFLETEKALEPDRSGYYSGSVTTTAILSSSLPSFTASFLPFLLQILAKHQQYEALC